MPTNCKENRQGLKARGKRKEDLMINIFKDVMATSDKDFVFYIKTKKHGCNEGNDISEDQLMKFAFNKHVNKKQDG